MIGSSGPVARPIEDREKGSDGLGSGRERPERTGFAHLFEHLMFEGSGHVNEGEFDTLLEAAGGNNNGSTTSDRTNYWISVPSNGPRSHAAGYNRALRSASWTPASASASHVRSHQA